MKKILFICQKIGFKTEESTHCGVGIVADLTSNIVQKSIKHNFIPLCIDSQSELELSIQHHTPDIIIYSYHEGTTQWINDNSLRVKWPDIKHIMIHYDFYQKKIDDFKPVQDFHYLITDDVTATGNEYVFVVPRSIPTDKSYTNTVPNDPPIIGFQGFAFDHKGINNLVSAIQNEFDEATIRLHMPTSRFADPNGLKTAQCIKEINCIIHKPGIEVKIDTEFLSTEDIVEWLSHNDINCYFYDYLDKAGIATSPDYALSARKPIAITKSFQLRHLWDLEPSIIHSSTNTFTQIMNNGIEPLIPVYKQNAHKALIAAYENIVDSIT